MVEKTALTTKDLGRFAAGVAHKVNNFLNVITSQAYCLKELLHKNKLSQKKAAEIKEGLEIILENSEKSGVMLRNMLWLGADGQVYKREADVNDLIEKVLSLAARKLRLSGVNIGKELAAALPAIKVDGEQLELVLLNIILNIQPALSRGDNLKVKTYVAMAEKEKRLAVEISCSREVSWEEGDIFSPACVSAQGRGEEKPWLGWFIVKEIIEAHQGEFTAAAAQAAGTTFTITLPVGAL